MNPWLPVKKQTPHIKNTAQKEIKNTCLSMFVANIRCSQMLDGPRFNKKKLNQNTGKQFQATFDLFIWMIIFPTSVYDKN